MYIVLNDYVTLPTWHLGTGMHDTYYLGLEDRTETQVQVNLDIKEYHTAIKKVKQWRWPYLVDHKGRNLF